MQELVITLATPIFVLLILIEMGIAWRRKQTLFEFGDTINSLSLGVLSQVCAAFMRLLIVGIYAWFFEHAALFSLPKTIWVGLIGLLAYDFLYYWLHRAGHEIAVIWAAHVVHHQSERYNLTTALRQTTTGPLLSWIFYLPLAILGVPTELFIGIALTDLLYQFWVHTELIGKLGWFDKIFVSPSNHRVHHATNDHYLDKNYGGILIIWDRIFGTFIEEDDAHKIVYGTRSPLQSWNPIKANVEVYQALWRNAVLAKNWADKVRCWVKHPGWQPADVAARAPYPAFDLHHANFEPALPRIWKIYCALHFTLIFSITAHFLAINQSLPTPAALIYGAWFVAGLWTIGGLCEGRKSYLKWENIRLAATFIFVNLTGQWFGNTDLSKPFLALILIVTMASLIGVFHLKNAHFDHKRG